jgi:hypothetical protein
MIQRLLLLALAAGLAACATPQRQGPPAAVVTANEPKHEPASVVAPAPKPPGPKPVQLYAYRPPSEAARIAEAPPSAAVDAEPEGAEEEVGAGARAGAAPITSAPQSPKVSSGTESARAPQPKAPTAAPPAPEIAAAPVAVAPGTPVEALRSQAERQRQAGDFAGAAATLERAVGLKPQDAQLWNRLARVRMEQGLHSQAANLAAKSNALAGDQPAVKQDNWSIIATARRQTGDAAGAADAERRATGG